ncbi:protein mesh-like [Saccostrea echinata]|uniref:protein mesh-like n=1 Tax=Saccostrea echinata TaxID=191078 RepID=UPI002A810C7A|nr:protein mesh-like [Saccostrea echinata]
MCHVRRYGLDIRLENLTSSHRSKRRCVRGDESTSISSESSNGLRKYAGTPDRLGRSLQSETNHVDCIDGSKLYSLPRYNVHENRAYGYFESDHKYVGNPVIHKTLLSVVHRLIHVSSINHTEMQIITLALYIVPGCLGIVEFYPFGLYAGDSTVSKNDDGSSTEIHISTRFPFFNHQHDHLIVNTNGVISFLRTVSTYTPNPFPLDGDRRLVAIFWADVDTREGGTVWYRESTNQTILNRATNEVRKYFPQFFRFQATWVFIATWDNVAFYGCSPCWKRNTFQEILITNGQHSFTIFNYEQIQWTTGTASNGDANTGLGGIPAQVGFNAGDGKVFYVVNASRTADIINVNHMSNIGVPGKFAFRIDAAEIGNGGCNTQGRLMISPRHGPMLGGQYLVISGPCLNPDDVIQIKYSQMLELFLCQRKSNYSAICITPTFNLTGDITVSVIIRDNKGDTQRHTGIYTIVNPAVFKNPVKRHLPQNWINGNRYIISWEPQAFELRDSERVHIHLFTMKEQSYNQLVWEKSMLHDNIVRTLGTYTIRLQTDGYMAAIRVTSAIETDTNLLERGIWSEIFAVVPQHQKSRRFCQDWVRQEYHLSRVSSQNIPPCPCTLQQALMDTARYQPDPDCNMVTKIRDENFNCLNRADAQHCVRLSMPGPLDNDNVCCYDFSGNLIDTRVKEGGTLQRYHYLGGGRNIPYITNFYYDVLPFLHCCRYYGTSSDAGQGGKYLYSECQDYLNFRKVSSCYNYIPPRPAGANGDPHLKTLDGFGYNFNGLGEFHFIVSRNMSFESQIRFEQAKRSNGAVVDASICTSFVAHVSNTTDKVEIILNSIRVADVLINGQIQDFSDVSWLRYNGVSVLNLHKTSINATSREILVMFADAGVSFRILASYNVLNVIPIIANDSLKGTISGLLGDFDGNPSNDLLLPNGSVLEPNVTEETIYMSFKNAWRITSVESLFTYPNGKTYEDYNNDGLKNFFPEFLSSVVRSATPNARALCGNNTDCLFDFHVTGSLEIAQATLDFTEELQDAEDASVPVITCPVLEFPEGGIWISNSTQENAIARFACGMGYLPIGYCQSRTCINGVWTHEQQCLCEKVTTTTPPSTHQMTMTSTPYSRTKENAAMLQSVYDTVRVMWYTVGGGTVVIIIIVFITSLLICFKMRSQGQYMRNDKSTSSYSESSNGYRKTAGRHPRSRGSYYNPSELSERSLPRYNVHDNRAFGYLEADDRYTGVQTQEHRRHDVLY